MQDNDDLYVIEYARSKDSAQEAAFIVSNDMYRDHMKSFNTDPSFAAWLKQRLISYSFVADDDFMPGPQAMQRMKEVLSSPGASGGGGASAAPAAPASSAAPPLNQRYPAAGAGSGLGAGTQSPATTGSGLLRSTAILPHSDVEDSDDDDEEGGGASRRGAASGGSGTHHAGQARHVLGTLEMASSSAAPGPTGQLAAQSSIFEQEHSALVRGMSALMSHPTYAAEVGPAVVKQRIQLPCGQCLGGAAPLHSIIMAHWAGLTPARIGGSGPAAPPAGGGGGSSGPAVPGSSSAGPAVPSAPLLTSEQVCERVMSHVPAALGEGSRARATAALVRDGVHALAGDMHALAQGAMAEAGLQGVASHPAAASVFAAAAVEYALTDWLQQLGRDAAARSRVYSCVIMMKVPGEPPGGVAQLTPAVLAATMTQPPRGGWQGWVLQGEGGAGRLAAATQAGLQAVQRTFLSQQ